jgi:multidrug efflux pump subunit AcrA (membrane-fusion protein)
MFLRLKAMSKKKKIVIGIVLVIAIFIGVQIYRGSTAKPNYTFGTVTRSDITEIVSETGKVSASGITPILSPANGVVTNVYVENGDDVTAGETLFTIRSTATEQEKSQAYATYLTAKTSLDAAQSNALKLQATMFGQWKSFKDLAESDTYEEADGKPKDGMRTLAEFHISQKEWLASEKDFQNQQIAISQAQAAVNSTYLLYQATQNATVKATAAGRISNVSVSQEETVTATGTKPLALIMSNAKTEATVSLSENDVTKVQKGQSVTIEMKALR